MFECDWDAYNRAKGAHSCLNVIGMHSIGGRGEHSWFNVIRMRIWGYNWTSRPKAREGHRYPRPAGRFVYGTL